MASQPVWPWPLDVLPGLLQLVEQGERWAATNGIVLHPRLANEIADARRFVANFRSTATGIPPKAVSATVALMSSSEVALTAGVSTRYVTGQVKAGRLRAVRRGRAWLFARPDVETWLADRKAG
jgi:excisionase family DNA binding protein